MPSTINATRKTPTRKSTCAICHRTDRPLQSYSLTGVGDHPRHFAVCENCIKFMLVNSPAATDIEEPPPPVMTDAEKKYVTRRQKAFERLGTDRPVCACCGEPAWQCMELHHLEGEQFGKTLIVVCRNCHRKLSDAQKDHPPKLGNPPTTIESIGHFLDGLADLLVLLARKLREFAAHLIEEARSRAGAVKADIP
jgi:hypothetical protein